MATLVWSAQPIERVAYNRLLWVVPLTIVAAIAANVLIQQLAAAVLRADPQLIPLTPVVPIVLTFVGVLGAVVVYALVGRFSHRPVWLFRRIALVTLVVSFILAIPMLITGFNPGTTVATVAVLMLMHVVAWAISVAMLTRPTRAVA